MINKKMLSLLLCIPAITITMEDGQMVAIRTMEEVRQYVGQILVCKPRTILGEAVVDPGWHDVNYSYINPDIDAYRQRGSQEEVPYYYFHVLNKYSNPIVTRVISSKTLAEEPLRLRVATQEEESYVNGCLSSSNIRYTMEFSKHPSIAEAWFTCKRLNNCEPKMARVEKALEDTSLFAGRIVAFRIPWALAEECTYELKGSKQNIRYGKISTNAHKGDLPSNGGYSLMALKRSTADALLCRLGDTTISQANVKNYAPLMLRLASLKEIEAILGAFHEGLAYFEDGTGDKDAQLLDQEYARAKYGSATQNGSAKP